MDIITTIQSAILEVMKRVNYVMTTKADGLSYRYLAERKMIETVRPAMLDNNIIVYPIANKVEQTHTPNAKGNVLSYSICHATFRFYHTLSGTFIDVETVGEGVDSTGDKASGKAATSAFKYALRHAFMLETSDEERKRKSADESESEDEETTLDKIKDLFDEHEEVRTELKAINAKYRDTYLGGKGNISQIKDEAILKELLSEYEKIVKG